MTEKNIRELMVQLDNINSMKSRKLASLQNKDGYIFPYDSRIDLMLGKSIDKLKKYGTN